MTPLINHLLRRCRPSTVRWLIVSIVVLTVNGQTFSEGGDHVFEKGLIVVPSGAHTNAATSPFWIFPIISVVASVPNLGPRSVERVAITSGGVPVGGVSGARYLNPNAAARLNQTTREMSPENDLVFSALTLARPIRKAVAVFDVAQRFKIQDCQSSEFNTGEVFSFKWFHSLNITKVSKLLSIS